MDIKRGTKISEALEKEIEKSKCKVVGAKFNNEYTNLDYKIQTNGEIELVDMSTKEGIKIYRRTLIYIMGKAFQEVYPEALITVDYQLANEMYCEIDNMQVTKEMISKVKKKMKEIIKKDLKIEKRTMTREEAEEFFEKTGTIRGKLQIDLKTNPKIYMYFCEDYYNYSYETLANKTSVITIFDIVTYGDGFLIRYPDTSCVARLPRKIKRDKLAWSLEEYQEI